MFENLTLVLAQSDARPDAGAAPTATPAPAGGGGEQTQTGAPAGTEGGAKSPDQTGQNGQTPPPFGGMGALPLLLVVFLVVMFGMTFFSQRKEKKKRADMLGNLKKNDRIVTIGGIIGTIVEVRDTEIVVKVDESSNTRMRFSRNAIQGIVGEEDAAAK